MGRELKPVYVNTPPPREAILCDITEEEISEADIAVESEEDNIVISREFFEFLPRGVFEAGDEFPKTKFLIDSYFVNGLCNACANLLEEKRPIPDMNSGIWLLTIESGGYSQVNGFNSNFDELEKYVKEHLFDDNDNRQIFGLEVFVNGVPMKAYIDISVKYGG